MLSNKTSVYIPLGIIIIPHTPITRVFHTFKLPQIQNIMVTTGIILVLLLEISWVLGNGNGFNGWFQTKQWQHHPIGDYFHFEWWMIIAIIATTTKNLIVFTEYTSDWMREAHFVSTPKTYCCYLSWLIVISQNSLNLL